MLPIKPTAMGWVRRVAGIDDLQSIPHLYGGGGLRRPHGEEASRLFVAFAGDGRKDLPTLEERDRQRNGEEPNLRQKVLEFRRRGGEQQAEIPRQDIMRAKEFRKVQEENAPHIRLLQGAWHDYD